MSPINVLVACEFSGVVRDAFIQHGCNATSCDILPSESGLGPHHQGDVGPLLNQQWDLLIAHPPCTYLCNSGVCWLHKREGRWQQLEQACKFFLSLKNANIPHIAIENPIPHKYAVKNIGKYSQLIQPWQFGHGETKATCLWLKKLPLLKPADIVSGRVQRLHRLPPSPDRANLRSKTYRGIAQAMALQWGNYIKEIGFKSHNKPYTSIGNGA